MSMPAVIENPVLNSPFAEPTRHFRFDDDGITNEVATGRRVSSYFIPIAQPKKKGRQLLFDTEWTRERIEENAVINRIRGRVAVWRQGSYQGVTRTTRRLLDYWQDPEREKRLFFCQIEALETAIYCAEVAGKYGDDWIETTLRDANEAANPDLFRIAFKMATGSGKTVVMAMLIAWQALNKLATPRDRSFSDAFLIVTPGITIRDRLRVLLPNDPANYYVERDLLPPELLEQMQQAQIVITNFHAFNRRERGDASRLTKRLLGGEESGAFRESADEMVRRVCRELGNKRGLVVINDEAHHCYRRKPGAEAEKLTADERREALQRESEARIWISGLESVKAKFGVRGIYDLSATPFFLRGSGYPEGTLFPWVVSDFSLIDAIESGIVKVPRVPVADDQMTGEQPTYRDLWPRIRDDLPKKGRAAERLGAEPQLPVELEGALLSLYGNYAQAFSRWQASGLGTPPVFIVVCNNTNVSKLVADWIGGWGKPLPDGSSVLVLGRLPLFSNVVDGRWRERPLTLLVDSVQLESGEAMDDAFKKAAATEIARFKAEYRQRYPGRDAEALTDEDLLREVMNTVGKPGLLGEQVRCVVSVSMLTEGWDANTVTHILGVRAFGTQLLCEQVVGRGLRRISYVAGDDGKFEPEYAEVYGVPFSFIPTAGGMLDPKPPRRPVRVRAVEARTSLEITFPRLTGYRYDLPGERLTAGFTADSCLTLSTEDVPTVTELRPFVGESSTHTLDSLRTERPQTVAFGIAKRTLERYFREEGNERPWLFPDLLRIARAWLAECVACKDNAFPQLLLLAEFAETAAERIYQAVVTSTAGEKLLKPVLRTFDTIGSTRFVDFDTTKPVYETHPDRCHVNYVVADTESWEQKLAASLEEMDEIFSYVKNQGLGFRIPYVIDGEEHSYEPDFIVQLRDGFPEPRHLIVEVTGERRRDKAAKVATARNLWVPAVNNHGGFGRWAFTEVTDPWEAASAIRAAAYA